VAVFGRGLRFADRLGPGAVVRLGQLLARAQ